MRGDILLLSHLIESMSLSVEKFETAKNNNKLDDFNKSKALILDLQKQINQEISKEFL